MISLNFFYSSKDSLFNYINENDIPNSESVLVQIFTSTCDKEFIGTLLENISFFLPKANIIGSTSAGEIDRGSISDSQTLINFTVFESSYCKLYHQNGSLSSINFGSKIARNIDKTDLKAVITFASSLDVNAQEYLKTFTQSGLDVPIAGGLASDNAAFTKTYVFTKEKIFSKGAVAVSLHGKSLLAYGDRSFGWEAIGRQFTVTKARNNKVYTVDHQPIKNLYETYLGKEIVEFLPASGIEFPMIIQKQGISLARFVTAKDEEGFFFSGDLKEGDKIYFGFANIEQILEQKDALAKRLSQNPIETIYVYSCLARKRLLGQMCEMELEPLTSLANVCGFFTNAEFYFHQEAKNYEMLNHNMTLLALSESKDRYKNFTQRNCLLKTQSDRTIKALSRFISQTSKQLNMLNQELSSTVYQKTTELRKSNKNLLKQVYYDDLTGLGNRTLLLKMTKGKQERTGLILIDINNFKDINDLYGVASGDEVLKQVAFLINSHADGKNLHAFRVSGDEFAIMCKEDIEKVKALELIDTLVESVKQTVFKVTVENHSADIYLSVAIGFAYKNSGLFEQANLAMAKAKKEGASYVEYLHSLQLEKNIQNNILWNNKVRIAISQDNIVPFFQPIFTNGEQNKYETLMRLIDGEGKAVSPFFFLDIAKKSGDYHKLTQIIVQKACETFASRQEKFSINLSYEDMVDDASCRFIKHTVQKYNVAHKLIVEIVESEYIKNFEKVNLFLNELKAMGTQIAIDDFGSGYANFSYLTQIKPNYIKIDGSIMKNIDSDKDALMIAETITMFAKKMGAKTVGEFIHSQEVLQKAIDLGIDSFQGFLLGEPKPF